MSRVLAVVSMAVLVMCGCSSGNAKSDAGSAPPKSASSTTSASPTTTDTLESTEASPTSSATPNTQPGEIRGTATDFCSAIKEGATRISAARGPITDAAVIINEWGADMFRFAPASLQSQVKTFTTDLFGVAENVGLGVITTNELLSSEVQKVLSSPDAAAVGAYGKASCP